MAARTKRKPDAEKVDVYQVVTDAIVARLEAGVIPWRKPWTSAIVGDGAPRNLISRRAYRGINVLLLDSMGYEQPWWLSAKQSNELGAHVRKGERSTPVSFWKRLRVRPGDDYSGKVDEDGLRTIFMLRYYRVFNVEQIEWGEELPSLLIDRIVPDEDEPDPPAPDEREDMLGGALHRYHDDGGPALLARGGDRAFYAPLEDHIKLPAAKAFHSVADELATWAHEAIHSTGHRSRLAREEIVGLTSTRGESYAREELVAELGSAMLCARFGVASDERMLDNRAAYVASWLKALKDDPKMVVQAGGRAQKAVECIAGPIEDPEDDITNEGEQA